MPLLTIATTADGGIVCGSRFRKLWDA